MQKTTNIKNYTSSVPADQSVLNIERKLSQHGVTRVMKEYDGFGNVSAIAFQKQHHRNQLLSFQLPAKIDSVHKLFLKQKIRPTADQTKKLYDQAKRTAWKNVSDWVDIQMTMIALEQVEFAEVFLPYALVAKGQTLFQSINKKGFPALGDGH